MAKPLTLKERTIVYNEIILGLDKLGLSESSIEGINKLKVMSKLFKDYGMEFHGEIELPMGQMLVYAFYKDNRRKNSVEISRSVRVLQNYKKEVDEKVNEENK